MVAHGVCPSCGGPKWPGYELCNVCRLEKRKNGRWPFYRDRHPIIQCPNCDTWILRRSKCCPTCQKDLRNGVIDHIHSWVPHDTYHQCSVCSLIEPHYYHLNGAYCLGLCRCGDLRHIHAWEYRDTYHECATCGLKGPHYWDLDAVTCFGVCRHCGAGRQFPTPMQVMEQLVRRRRAGVALLED